MLKPLLFINLHLWNGNIETDTFYKEGMNIEIGAFDKEGMKVGEICLS